MTTAMRRMTRAVVGPQRRFASSMPKKTSPFKAQPRAAIPPYVPKGPRPKLPSEPETLEQVWRKNWLPLSGAAFFSAALGFYIFGTFAGSWKELDGVYKEGTEHSHPTGRPPALSGDNAEQFDKDLNWEEWWMGITGLRQKLASRAQGHVLELAMGTGRNLEYYNWEALGAAAAAASKTPGGAASPRQARGGITSFTGLDISVDMLDVARKKLVEAVPPMAASAPVVRASTMADHTGGELSYLGGLLRFINSDAHRPLPLPATSLQQRTSQGTLAPVTKYDTVIQTFGLCSVSDPVSVVSNLASVVKPETGRIILLEHGKGWFGIVNGLLDKNAWKHFEKFGCWWNRDIPALVEEAAARTPGLEVVKIERPNLLQMGTLIWIELKVLQRT